MREGEDREREMTVIVWRTYREEEDRERERTKIVWKTERGR